MGRELAVPSRLFLPCPLRMNLPIFNFVNILRTTQNEAEASHGLSTTTIMTFTCPHRLPWAILLVDGLRISRVPSLGESFHTAPGLGVPERLSNL
jgi:hypothetical protein